MVCVNQRKSVTSIGLTGGISMTVQEAQSNFTDRTVLKVKEAEIKGYIILCHFKGREFVTWWWDGKSKSGDNGHYFSDNLYAALNDYEERK